MSFQISEYFNLYKKDKIKEKNTKVFFYEHKKSKAKVLFYDCENVNAAFGIYFRTPVEDSSGITHILEHSVFEGSRKYNHRGNLDYLLNNSLATFLNAATFQDRTMYYFSSSFKKDFLNILDIYLDFVFFPVLDDRTFQREGYFYKKENGKYEFNGIVFNEMKDSLLGYERRNYFDTLKNLYPNSTFAHLQGGDPIEITDLTNEDIKKYHKDYYHPSNSYTIIYGKVDKKKVFQKLNEYFSEFEYKKINHNLEVQSIKERKVITDTYQDYLVEDGLVSFTKAIAFTQTSNFEEDFVMEFLTNLLFKYEFSPVRRALEDSGLISGISNVYYDNFNNTPYFKIDFRGINEKDIKKINEIFYKTLKKLSKKIDNELKEAVYKKYEFYSKEFNFYEGQGLNYIIESSTEFMHGDDPVEQFKTLKALKKLKKNINGKKLERIIKEKFLNNERVLDFTLKPDSKLMDKYKQDLDIKLENRMKLMDIKKLDEEIEKFDNWKEVPKKDVVYKSQKKISPKDLDVSIVKYDSKYEDLIFRTHINSDNIVRLELNFDISKIDLKSLSYFSIYLYIYYYLSSDKYNFEKFNLIKSKFLSSVNIDIKNYNDQVTENSYLSLYISLKYLKEDFSEVLEIFDQMVNHTIFDDKARLKFLINEYYQLSKDGIDSNFKENSQFYLSKFFTPFGEVYEGIKGLPIVKDLDRISKNFNEEYDELVLNLMKIHQFIFSSNLSINLGTSEKYERENVEDIKKLVSKLKLNLVDKSKLGFFVNPNYKDTYENQNFFHKINSDTNFNFLAVKYQKFPHTIIHKIKFVSEYMYQYLFEKIRINHGAYGASFKIYSFDNAGIFKSWSDPLINETFSTFLSYKNSYDVGKFSKSKFERLKKQMIGGLKKIYSNDELFSHSYENFMTNRTVKDREQIIYDTKFLTYKEFKDLFKYIKNPKFIIKLVCTNESNIKNFKEDYIEIKGL